jgi:hypothetical protein
MIGATAARVGIDAHNQCTTTTGYRLLHGPYRMPRCRLGGRLFCEERGWVTVERISDGNIPWPQTVVRRSRAFILCGGLAKAVRRESAIAVCHWWGVTPQTVSKWRKALGVPQVNEGTARLYRDYAPERLTEDVRKRALAAANGPEANAKKAAFRLGKPAHPRARAALASYWGQSPSAETRRKMSEAHRRRGTRLGLLIGDDGNNGERAVYLCPTRQLVNQVADQATSQYGLDPHAFTGSRAHYDPTASADWQSAEAISLTTYSSLFNTNPFFCDPNLVILDDAHSAENYVSSFWSLQIDRSHPEHAAAFSALGGLLLSVLPHADRSRLATDKAGRNDRGDQPSDNTQAIRLLSERVSVLAVVNNHLAGHTPRSNRALHGDERLCRRVPIVGILI